MRSQWMQRWRRTEKRWCSLACTKRGLRLPADWPLVWLVETPDSTIFLFGLAMNPRATMNRWARNLLPCLITWSLRRRLQKFVGTWSKALTAPPWLRLIRTLGCNLFPVWKYQGIDAALQMRRCLQYWLRRVETKTDSGDNIQYILTVVQSVAVLVILLTSPGWWISIHRELESKPGSDALEPKAQFSQIIYKHSLNLPSLSPQPVPKATSPPHLSIHLHQAKPWA